MYELSRRLGEMNPAGQSHGFLGGEWGYGQDFRNDTFTMFPFYWGECYETDETTGEYIHDEGCPGGDDCLADRANFTFGDLSLRWYKYIGRDMESSRPVSRKEWRRIFAACNASLDAIPDSTGARE
jgi:hypothetical protein